MCCWARTAVIQVAWSLELDSSFLSNMKDASSHDNSTSKHSLFVDRPRFFVIFSRFFIPHATFLRYQGHPMSPTHSPRCLLRTFYADPSAPSRRRRRSGSSCGPTDLSFVLLFPRLCFPFLVSFPFLPLLCLVTSTRGPINRCLFAIKPTEKHFHAGPKSIPSRQESPSATLLEGVVVRGAFCLAG